MPTRRPDPDSTSCCAGCAADLPPNPTNAQLKNHARRVGKRRGQLGAGAELRGQSLTGRCAPITMTDPGDHHGAIGVIHLYRASRNGTAYASERGLGCRRSASPRRPPQDQHGEVDEGRDRHQAAEGVRLADAVFPRRSSGRRRRSRTRLGQTLPSRDARQVRDPQLVRSRRRDGALHEVCWSRESSRDAEAGSASAGNGP